MARSMTNSVLDRGNRDHGARAVAGSMLHDHYAPMFAAALPAGLGELVSQLVAFEAHKEKSSGRSAEVLQFAPGPRGPY